LRFPAPYHEYVLTGKSRAAWHTSFVIPQLNLLLDAGLVVNSARPKHIFLTHGHSDHTLLAPAFMKREDPPDVFCPAEMVGVFEEFIRAWTMLNLGGVAGGTGEDEDDVKPDSDLLTTHITHGLVPGSTVPLRRLKAPITMTATAFACAHTVPSLGYVFHATTQRLLPQYIGLPGPVLRDLRRAGTPITGPHEVPVFAFLGDGTAETLAADPEWLRRGCRVVITECSFLYAEHRAAATRTKHTIWEDLEPVVRRWKETVFVVCHFSLRYSDEEVRRFFAEMREPVGNVVVWVDGGC
jgi:ribonuclease Z